MELDRWIAALAEKLGERTSPERCVAYLRPRLEDLSPYWFTEASIAGIWMKLRSLNSADRVRKALREYHTAQSYAARPPPVSEAQRDAAAWEKRQEFLRRDWDDPGGITRRVRDCRGNVLMLRLLGKLVRQWAPQHLGFLPPHILEAIEDDSEIAPRDLHLRYADDTPPEGTRSVAEQLEALGERPTARYLSPADLDRINPLPNGAKRYAPANDTAAPVGPDAA